MRRAGSSRTWLCALLFPAVAGVASTLPQLRIAGSSTVYPVAAAWAARLSHRYSFEVEGGGSTTGARRVCADRGDPQHVDIGDMSREWKSSEALRLDDGYTLECLVSKNRVTQVMVGVDGLAIVVANAGPAHDCLTHVEVGGLTLAELRWIFSDWSNDALEEDGVRIASLLQNDNHNGVKEWSDLHQACAQVPINPYGAGDMSGTHDFFGEVVFCKKCFQSKAGYAPEYFASCSHSLEAELRGKNNSAGAEWISSGQRPPNCYLSSEVDEQILGWLLADGAGIAYFGFAYYNGRTSDLTVARIASDRAGSIRDTSDAAIAPSIYTIVDGSYSVFRRNLFMNVDNEVWDLVRDYMEFGFSADGQREVLTSGYAKINTALLAKMIQRIPPVGSKGNELADYVPVRPASCPPGMRLHAASYVNMRGTSKTNYTCKDCPVGTFKSGSEAAECAPCIAGSFADRRGMSLCEVCDRGTYSVQNASQCTQCAPNEFVATPGRSSCDPCPQGRFCVEPGQWSCQHCPLGKYRQAADSNCVPCGAGLTTSYLGAETPEACLCAEGSYRGADGAACLPCPAGMLCPLGSSYANLMRATACQAEASLDAFSDAPALAFPLVRKGHMTMPDDTLRVFKCLTEGHCPGGCPGRCAANRDTTAPACAKCSSGSYESGDECVICSGIDLAPAIVALVVCVASLVLFILLLNRDPGAQTSSGLMVVVLTGLLLMSIQTLGIFAQLRIEWFEPASTILHLMALMSFDLGILRVSCMLGNSPLLPFVIRQLLAPCAVPIVLATVKMQTYFQGSRHQLRTGAASLNAIGGLFHVFFISMVVSGVQPLICYQHPSEKESSVQMAASVLCFQGGTHTVMVAVGIGAILAVPLPFVGMTMYGAWQYPYWVASTNDPRAFNRLKCYRFLFMRFRPEKYYYGVVILIRSVLVCFVPVIIHNDAAMQIIVMSALLAGFMLLQQDFQPWRHHLSNVVDGSIIMLMVMLLMAGSMSLGTTASMHSLQVLGTVGFCLVAVIFTVTLGFGIYRRLRPRPFYDLFICHHKAAAGGQARLLKSLLQVKTFKRVFIDSDDLRELDSLFDIVKCQVGHVVVYLTRDTLSRPWCAGEITTAFRCGVQVTQVRTGSFTPPTEENFSNMDQLLNLSSGCLAKYEISEEDVADAYRQLLSTDTKCVRLRPELLGTARFDILASEIAGLPLPKSRHSKRRSSPTPPQGDLPILARTQSNRLSESMLRLSQSYMAHRTSDMDQTIIFSSEPSDDEATAACGILKHKVQQSIFSATGATICCLADYPEDLPKIVDAVVAATATVVFLSASTLESEPQLVAIIKAIEGGGASASRRELWRSSSGALSSVIPVSLPSFTFPNENYYTEILPRFWSEDLPETRDSLEAFFRQIAMPLDTHASDSVLEIQARQIAARIQQESSSSCPIRAMSSSSTFVSEDKVVSRLSSRATRGQTTESVDLEMAATGVEEDAEPPPPLGPPSALRPKLLRKQSI